MGLFTASRLDPNSSSTANGGGGGGGNSNARNVKPKVDGSVAKAESDVGKDERAPRAAAAAGVGSLSGIVVKEDLVKSIFTDNIQTSGAYCAREENLRLEV